MRRRHVRAMGLGELVYRCRQETSKWLERSGTSKTARMGTWPVPGLESSMSPDPVRFFEGATSAQLPQLLIERTPDACDQIVAEAEAACRHRFDLLGYSDLSFGDPIDWHLDPTSGRRAPRVHWSRLDPLDAATVGDSKVVWELNRHQWFVQLGLAYRLTGDERFADAFATNALQWMDANPPGIGINWASSLEVAFRLISWCWSTFLFRDSPALSSGLLPALLQGIRTHADHVERYLSYYFSPNTHLTGEALGLFYAGLFAPQTHLSDRWCAIGARILIDECERQILPDGVYFEQATGYQRYTLEIYLHFLILCARNGRPVPSTVSERVQRMLDFLLTIRFPDGSMPLIGDADSGSLLPLARRAQHDFQGVFATAAAWLGRADCAWAAGSVTPEILWLLGPPGLDEFEALEPAPPAAAPSRCFSDGGYVIMQDGWAPDRHQLTFDVGPLGCPVSAGHGHADLLSVQCAVYGEPYVVDAGTYAYTSDPIGRAFFRGTAAHNTVTVDGEPQSVPAGPFRWSERPRATLRDWHPTSSFDLADAEHSAYARLPSSVVHRRRVVFVKSKYWIIADDLDGTGEHALELRFQFAPMDVSIETSPWARAVGRTGSALLVRPFSTAPLTARVRSGDSAPMQGWISDEYGRRRPAPVLIYSAVAELPTRIVTLLLPTADPHAAVPAVAPLFDEAAMPVGIAFEHRESVQFGGSGILVSGS